MDRLTASLAARSISWTTPVKNGFRIEHTRTKDRKTDDQDKKTRLGEHEERSYCTDLPAGLLHSP